MLKCIKRIFPNKDRIENFLNVRVDKVPSKRTKNPTTLFTFASNPLFINENSDHKKIKKGK